MLKIVNEIKSLVPVGCVSTEWCYAIAKPTFALKVPVGKDAVEAEVVGSMKLLWMILAIAIAFAAAYYVTGVLNFRKGMEAPKVPVTATEAVASKPTNLSLAEPYTFAWEKTKEVTGRQRILKPIKAVMARFDSNVMGFSTPGNTNFGLNKNLETGEWKGVWSDAKGNNGEIWLIQDEETGGFSGEVSNDMGEFIPCSLDKMQE